MNIPDYDLKYLEVTQFWEISVEQRERVIDMMQEQSLLCSDLSRSVDEPLFGTAPQTDTWLLLEYQSPYGAKALEESNLSDQIKSHLVAIQRYLPNPRLVLIKKNGEKIKSRINFFLGFAHDWLPRLYHMKLKSYNELLDVDFQSYLTGDPSVQDKLHTKPIFLVCTNGRRDRCCAKFGLPLYEALSGYIPGEVWQSSHVGGHRFAGNLVCLPHGIYYGRIPIEQGTRLIDAYSNRSIIPEYYRGRACYTPAQQAAEYYLRSHTGILGIDDIHLVETLELDADHWSLVFENSQGEKYYLRIYRELSDFDIFDSCNTPEKRNRQSLYELQDIKLG